VWWARVSLALAVLQAATSLFATERRKSFEGVECPLVVSHTWYVETSVVEGPSGLRVMVLVEAGCVYGTGDSAVSPSTLKGVDVHWDRGEIRDGPVDAGGWSGSTLRAKKFGRYLLGERALWGGARRAQRGDMRKC